VFFRLEDLSINLSPEFGASMFVMYFIYCRPVQVELDHVARDVRYALQVDRPLLNRELGEKEGV